MRASPSPSSSSPRSIFGIGTPDDTAAMERSSSTPSSSKTPPASSRPPRSPLGVDEEYDSAFKSKSFLDLWSHAHRHLMHTFSSAASFKLASSSSKSGGVKDDEPHDDTATKAAAAALEQSCSYTVLDDFVLEPSPEVLGRRRRRRRRRVERLLIEYFDVTQEACEACSSLLAAIGAARRHQLTLRRLLHRLEVDNDGGGDDPGVARDAVAAHVSLDNPLSPGRLAGFHEVHGRCGPLAARLASAQRRLRRLARAMCVARGTAAAALAAACAAAVVAAVVFAAHAVVGVGAAAACAAVGGGATTRPATAAVRWGAERVSPRRYARAGAAVDAAARGAYIVGRDLDTVSRMVRRAHDELEHGRDVARIAVRGGGGGRGGERGPLMQEVAREEAECEEDLRAQLEELEEHVCLCLITINRSRRMVAREMTQGLPPSSMETTPPPPTSQN